MKVVIDSHIPYLKGILEPYAEVAYLEPRDITPAAVKDADALIIRTRTRCDAQLLDGSRVKFIGTATIGYDHIDADYCKAHDIFWTNCPGCNAQGVSDYVETALYHLGYFDGNRGKDNILPVAQIRSRGYSLSKAHPSAFFIDKITIGPPQCSDKITIGIVGVGHVGKLVEEMAMRHWMDILLCDPPRDEAENGGNSDSAAKNADENGKIPFVSLDEIARKADIITFHTPLTKEGKWPTWHMADEAFFAKVKKEALILNAARGGVVDEAALLKSGDRCVIDCWEGEPCINRDLLRKAEFATFHIAGYTKLGKFNASQMVLDAFSRFFGLGALKIEKNVLSLQTDPIFDIRTLSDTLKAAPEKFEKLREEYPLR